MFYATNSASINLPLNKVTEASHATNVPGFTRQFERMPKDECCNCLLKWYSEWENFVAEVMSSGRRESYSPGLNTSVPSQSLVSPWNSLSHQKGWICAGAWIPTNSNPKLVCLLVCTLLSWVEEVRFPSTKTQIFSRKAGSNTPPDRGTPGLPCRGLGRWGNLHRPRDWWWMVNVGNKGGGRRIKHAWVSLVVAYLHTTSGVGQRRNLKQCRSAIRFILASSMRPTSTFRIFGRNDFLERNEAFSWHSCIGRYPLEGFGRIIRQNSRPLNIGRIDWMFRSQRVCLDRAPI